jgi:hypothetical protein
LEDGMMNTHLSPKVDLEYYMLEYESDEDEAVLSDDPDEFDIELDWHIGARFERSPKEPIRLVIYAGNSGNGEIPEQCDVPLPVMSKRLRGIFDSNGVTNIDYYDALIVDEASGREFRSHVAYNLIGAIAACDLKKTTFAAANPSRLVDADIDKLKLDPARILGARIFRLAESVNGIVIHASLMRAVVASGIKTLLFMPPEEWIS